MTIPEEIEQLKVKLEQTADEREQGEELMEILQKFTSIGSTDSQPQIDHLFQLAEKLNEPLYKASALYHLANLKRIKGEYDVSIDLSQQALALFEKKQEKKGIAATYNNIGAVYFQQGNYPEALKNHFASLKIRKQIGNKFSIAASYSNIGPVYFRQGNYTEALKNQFAALKIYEEIGDKHGIGTSYGNIGAVYFQQGNYPETLENYFASLKILEEIGNQLHIAFVYSNIGFVYEKQGNYPEALKNYFASLKIKEEIDNKSGIGISYTNIGTVYYYQGNYPEALKEQLRALKIGEEIGNKEIIKESSISLTNVYRATRDFENALKYHEKYHQADTEMLGEQAQKQLTDLNFHHNMHQKEKDLEIEQLRNVDLKRERDRSDSLLLNILPAEVAEELKDKGKADAKLFDNVTVLFTDFKGFTTLAERLTPQQLVDELHACFSAFDEIMGRHNIEKIKTIGDAYLAVSGLPLANANHAIDVIKASMEICEFIKKRVKILGANTFDIRVGINSGSVVAGIVGIKKFAYDIWGDTVNTAARMEQKSESGKINISQTTYELVKDKFSCTYRGEIEAKNKGKLKMYFVN